MFMLNYAGLAWKYRQHWNRKLLSLLGSVLLKVLRIQTLVLLILVLELGVWLESRILVGWLSMSANYSLVLLLWWGFDCERVEDVGLLAVIVLVVGLLVGVSSQLGLLSAVTILGLGTGETVQPGWIVLKGDLGDEWMVSLVNSSWASWSIWQINHLVTETWDCIKWCPKRWDWSWRVIVRGNYFGLEVRIVELNCKWNCDKGFSRQNCSEATANLRVW